MLVCPENSEHKGFIGHATVVQAWILNAHGDYLDEFKSYEYSIEEPDPKKDSIICLECFRQGDIVHAQWESEEKCYG
jgi:hypothetical protein